MNRIDKKSSWKHKIHEIIYEADTKGGKIFDVILLIAILASILLVMLESVESFDTKYHSSAQNNSGLTSLKEPQLSH